MDQAIVIMEKNLDTGFLEKELATALLPSGAEYLHAVYAAEEEGQLMLNLLLTTERDVQDWEYEAILDYYDTALYNGKVLSMTEVSETFNPIWQIKAVTESPDDWERLIQEILVLHQQELFDVYGVIKEKESEYKPLS